jgi:hypothetical protein
MFVPRLTGLARAVLRRADGRRGHDHLGDDRWGALVALTITVGVVAAVVA